MSWTYPPDFCDELQAIRALSWVLGHMVELCKGAFF
jgi:hypothetical protein